MPRIITLDEKLAVIDDWLMGKSRNEISVRRSMGSGTVYNIVQEWSNEFGGQRADKLRGLAIKLKNNGLTVGDCAKGLRMLMIFRRYGIKDDDDDNNDDQEKVIHFLKEVYTKCQEVRLSPQQVFAYISDILKFSSEISLSQIPQFMKKRIEKKKELESAIQKLSIKIGVLSHVIEEKELEIERLSKMKETGTKTYQTFAILKRQLKQYGIGMENMDQFVKCVVGISKANYNLAQILKKIADYENLEKCSRYYNEQVDLKKYEVDKLNQQINIKQNILSFFKIKVDILHEVETMGFGINELRTLTNMLNEIGKENNQSFDEVRKEFFDDLKNYEEVIESRREIDRLKNELEILEVQTMKQIERYNAYPKIIESITRLSGAGISEADIIKIDRILSSNDSYLYKDKPLSSSKETLIADLQRYGNLKLAIKNLEESEINLKSKKKRTRVQTIKKGATTVKKTKRKKSGN
jgi:hypothetical protein